jgi:hypothetical protein
MQRKKIDFFDLFIFFVIVYIAFISTIRETHTISSSMLKSTFLFFSNTHPDAETLATRNREKQKLTPK